MSDQIKVVYVNEAIRGGFSFSAKSDEVKVVASAEKAPDNIRKIVEEFVVAARNKYVELVGSVVGASPLKLKQRAVSEAEEVTKQKYGDVDWLLAKKELSATNVSVTAPKAEKASKSSKKPTPVLAPSASSADLASEFDNSADLKAAKPVATSADAIDDVIPDPAATYDDGSTEDESEIPATIPDVELPAGETPDPFAD